MAKPKDDGKSNNKDASSTAQFRAMEEKLSKRGNKRFANVYLKEWVPTKIEEYTSKSGKKFKEVHYGHYEIKNDWIEVKSDADFITVPRVRRTKDANGKVIFQKSPARNSNYPQLHLPVQSNGDQATERIYVGSIKDKEGKEKNIYFNQKFETAFVKKGENGYSVSPGKVVHVQNITEGFNPEIKQYVDKDGVNVTEYKYPNIEPGLYGKSDGLRLIKDLIPTGKDQEETMRRSALRQIAEMKKQEAKDFEQSRDYKRGLRR